MAAVAATVTTAPARQAAQARLPAARVSIRPTNWIGRTVRVTKEAIQLTCNSNLDDISALVYAGAEIHFIKSGNA